MTAQAMRPAASRANRRVGLIALAGALAMLGLGFASVPLYRLFCQATGFGGTTQRSTEAEAAQVKAAGRTITIRFDANVAGGLPWTFRPEQLTQTLPIGQRKLATYEARNNTDRAITGQAVFNVTPEAAGAYFHKIECFCFTQQTLAPRQDVRMPVIYYVDPKILDDPDARDITEITLSYTFLEAAGTGSKAGGASGKTAAK